MLGKRFRRLEVWMIAKKATSTPLNPKSKDGEPRKGRLGSKVIPCVLSEEERIKSLLCLEERKNVERN